jgi:hypothetical protein
MDLRQAAEFFKTRWKWRKDPEWYREEQAKRAERQQAAVAAKKQKSEDKKSVEADTAQTPKQPQNERKTPQKNDDFQQSGKRPEPIIPKPDVFKPQQKTKQELLEERQAKEQQVIDLYLQQILETLSTIKADPEVKALQETTLDLLGKKVVEPKQLLDFGREVEKLSRKNKEFSKAVTVQKETRRQGEDRNVWANIERELKHLDSLEAKGEKLAFSANLAGTTLGILDAFLGPVGPLFKTARDIYEEYKDDAKGLLAKFSKIPKYVKDKFDRLRKIWRGRDTLFKRMFPKFTSALDKFGAKLKGMGGSLLDKLGGVGGKGKFGKLLGIAGKVTSVVSAIASSPLAQAGILLGINGLSKFFSSDKKSNTDAGKEGKPDKESPWSVSSITQGLSKAGGVVSSLFSDLSGWFSTSWKQLIGWASNAYGALYDSYKLAEIKARIIKDDIEEVRDVVWDSVTGWFAAIWERIKGLLPKSVLEAGRKVKQKAGEALDWGKDKVSQAGDVARRTLGLPPKVDKPDDGPTKPTAIRVPQVGDPATGQKAVIVRSGVDLGGMNPSLMNNFYAMVGEYNKLTGKRVAINSGKRSKEQQAALHAANPKKAARPGYSMHEFGLAIDIDRGEAGEMEALGLFKKYGFVRPISNEPWHVEPVAIQGVKSVIRRGNAEVSGAIEASAQQSGDGVAAAKTESEGVSQQPTPAKMGEDSMAKAVSPQASEGLNKTLPVPDSNKKSGTSDATVQAPSLATPGIVPSATSANNAGSQETAPVSVFQRAQNFLFGNKSKDTAKESQEAVVSSMAPTVTPAPQTSVGRTSLADAVVQESIAPNADGGYSRVESRSKRIDKVVTPISEGTATTGHASYQVGGTNIPLYLGDTGMLTLNLGIGG